MATVASRRPTRLEWGRRAVRGGLLSLVLTSAASTVPARNASGDPPGAVSAAPAPEQRLVGPGVPLDEFLNVTAALGEPIESACDRWGPSRVVTSSRTADGEALLVTCVYPNVRLVVTVVGNRIRALHAAVRTRNPDAFGEAVGLLRGRLGAAIESQRHRARWQVGPNLVEVAGFGSEFNLVVEPFSRQMRAASAFLKSRGAFHLHVLPPDR